MRPLPKMFLVTEGIENDENAMKLVDTIKAEQEFYLFDREYNAEKKRPNQQGVNNRQRNKNRLRNRPQ